MLPPLRDVIARHGLAAKKSLGQNFLLDLNITRKIAACAAPLAGVNVIEIGPGPGGLTRALLETDATHIYAIEKDERCQAALAELAAAAPGRLTIIPGDALILDPTAIAPAPRAIIANLPYNIATELLFGWLEIIYEQRRLQNSSPLEGEQARLASSRGGAFSDAQTPPHASAAPPPGGSFRSLTLMFQKEVANRITAAPGGKAYGRLSVMTQWLCETRREFDLPPSVFTPAPKVTSSVITVIPRSAPLFPADKKALETVLRHAFGQRRKMLRAALKPLVPDTENWLAGQNINPAARAETLTIEQFCRLARELGKKDTSS